MKHRHAIFRSRLGLALCFMLAGGAIIPQSSVLKAETSVTQQSRKITGTITDAKGEPLLGVNVVVKGTTNGTITDLDGKYVLEVEPDAILVISYIGYVTQQTPASGNVMNITLKEDTQNLDEVVVVGYGTQQKKDITGSVAVIDTEELLASSGSSATQQLQGKAAGVNIGTSGAPGSATMVRIRGINSINDNGPLYVIDGVSTRDQDLSSINPNDIESMQVLKDASSAAIYGAQAANGVILITTKKGTKTGQPRLTYDGYYGFSKTGKRYDVLNAYDRIDVEWQASKNNLDLTGASANGELPYHQQFGSTSDSWVNHLPNYMTVTGAGGSTSIDPSDYDQANNVVYAPVGDTNWWDEISQLGWMQNHQLSLSGGTDKGQYTMSMNYFDQQGTAIESYFTRYQARANSSYNVRPWLRFGENLTYSFSKNNGLSFSGTESNIYSWTYRASPYVPVYDYAGNYAGSLFAGTGNFQNPVAIRERNKDNYATTQRVFGNVYGEADLWTGLTFKTNFGIDYRNDYSYSMTKNNPEFSESGGQNNFYESNYFNYRWVWTNTLSFSRTFNEIHSLNILLGTEAIRDGLGRSLNARRYNYLFEDNTNTYTLDMGENNSQRTNSSTYNGEFALFGMFARADYGYKDKYLLTGIIRRDGVSRFSESNRYGVFPSISAGWRMSEEAFMEPSRDWLDDLKIRAGYGVTGNNGFGNGYTTRMYKANDMWPTNGVWQPGYGSIRNINPDLKWEEKSELNFGLDFSLFNDRLWGKFDLYFRQVDDMLYLANAPMPPMVHDEVMKNIGSLENRGWEFELGGDIVRSKNFRYTSTLRLSHNKTKIKSMGDDGFFLDEVKFPSPGNPGTAVRLQNGLELGQYFIYKYAGLDENGKWLIYDKNNEIVPAVDGTKSNLVAENKHFVGNAIPKVILSWDHTFRYKNWDLSVFLRSWLDYDVFSQVNMYYGLANDSQLNVLKSAYTRNRNIKDEKILCDYWIDDASFLKIDAINLGYTLDLKRWTRYIQSAKIYLTIRDVAVFTDYNGINPEVDINGLNPGFEYVNNTASMYPQTTRFTLGVQLTF